MLGYLQSQQQWEIIYTHCCISYSEKIKYIVAENSLSMRSRIIFQTKEQTKKKKKKKAKYEMIQIQRSDAHAPLLIFRGVPGYCEILTMMGCPKRLFLSLY